MLKNIKTKNILVLLVVSGLLFLGVYFYIIWMIENKNDSFSLIRDEINQVVISEEQSTELKRALKDTEDDRAKINSYFIANDGSVSFIEKIESLAVQSGVELKIESVVVKTPSDNPQDQFLKNANVEYLNLKISFTGSWNAVYGFLNMVEKLPFKIYFKNVGFTKTNSSGDVVDENDSAGTKEVQVVESKWSGTMDLDIIKKTK